MGSPRSRKRDQNMDRNDATEILSNVVDDDRRILMD